MGFSAESCPQYTALALLEVFLSPSSYSKQIFNCWPAITGSSDIFNCSDEQGAGAANHYLHTSKNDLTLLGPGCNSDLSAFAQANTQKTAPEWWERVSAAIEKEQKLPILLLFFLKRKDYQKMCWLLGGKLSPL